MKHVYLSFALAASLSGYANAQVRFMEDVKPILEFNCVACHQDGNAKGKLRLDNKESAFKGGDSGKAIVVGKSAESKLYTVTILDADDDDLMPPQKKGGPLPKTQTEILKNWIDSGAVWPDGISLTPKKIVTASIDEAGTVKEIHQKIVAGTREKEASEMKVYHEKIAGTEAAFDLVPIPAGEFILGSVADEKGRQSDEGPQAKIKISPFWMGKCEVTWNEYELFQFPDEEKKRRAGLNSPNGDHYLADATARPTSPYVEMSFGMGKAGYPAISMTQHAANQYCKWLSAKTGHFYRLPTEAEWEYACRAGTTTAYSFGNDTSALGDHAWFSDNSEGKYQKVGLKKPNPWGLYDMHGNVTEWTLDQYDAESYQRLFSAGAVDPWNKATKSYPHSARGGSWDDQAESLRSATRRGSNKLWKVQDPQLPKSIWYLTDAQFLGFRVVRPLKVPAPEEIAKYWTSGVERD